MKTGARIVALVVFGWLLLFGYRHFFPSQEARIRRMLSEVARAVSFPGTSSPLANLATAHELAGFLTRDVEVNVDVPAAGRHTFTGREEIIQAALAARSSHRSVEVKFLDINVELEPDKQTAAIELTAKITQTGERDFNVQELKFRLRKVDGEWRIARVDTVRTLGS